MECRCNLVKEFHGQEAVDYMCEHVVERMRLRWSMGECVAFQAGGLRITSSGLGTEFREGYFGPKLNAVSLCVVEHKVSGIGAVTDQPKLDASGGGKP